MASNHLFRTRVAFASTGALSLYASGVLFRDLTDFSQWVVKPNRNEVLTTYRNRHKLALLSVAGSAANTAIFFAWRKAFPSKIVWAGINAVSAVLLFSGYLNPELMMRPRNQNALYVSTCQAAKILKPTEMAIVTQLEDQEPRCFPESQLQRPHVARVGVKKDGTPAAIAYCALTGVGIVYETPDLPDGTPREFVPLTQLENNLVLLDKATGHVGHQINGLDETKLLEALGEESYDKAGRRLIEAELDELGVQPATEVASWRMSVGDFVRIFRHGHVFINDYKEFPELKKPVKTIYDKIMDLIFSVAIGHHNRNPSPLFPTVTNIDPRLESKTRVWGFNIGDSYVALTEDFVKQGSNGVRNMTVGGVPLVASYDPDAESLGVWKRPSNKQITSNVNVHGEVQHGRKKLKVERLNTVKSGVFWFSWQNFFPQTAVNPKQS